MRKFNIAGPVVEADHYHIPPLDRVNLDDVPGDSARVDLS